MAVGKKSSHKNAARSRHLIKQAFAELLNEKDMSKITVTDIVERANISRGTFYAHYLDVYDLYTAIQSNIVETLNETLELLGMENIILDPSKAIRTGIDFLDKNKEYYKLFLTSSHGETLIKRIMTLTEEKFTEVITQILPEEEAKEYIYHMYYVLGGLRNILLHWFEDRDPLSKTECSELLIKFYSENCFSALSEAVRNKSNSDG
ncbi:MAG: TetR/AcrR family transcriptional regulator [Clostridia bacterium]|nr:TetR/AcrR family transcriptional regulator [Clostridia bacterium]